MSIATTRRNKALEIISKLNLCSFVGGEYIDTCTDTPLQVSDPYTGKNIANIPSACDSSVNQAVMVAKEAFENGIWSSLHPRERANYMFKLAELIDKDLELIALVETLDTGRPYASSFGWEVPNAAEVIRYYAGWCDKIVGSTLPHVAGVDIENRCEPVGVCALLPAWNFPFAGLAWKLAPALAAGCTVVIKAPERAPLTTLMLAKYVLQAGFPAGVINIVVGSGNHIGDILVKNPNIDKISFTGSACTAQRIINNSLQHLPSWSLELGGKSANVILKDADLNKASQAAIGAMFTMSGQDCGAGSRLLIDRSVADKFIDILLPLIKSRRLGDPMDDSTEQGPLIDNKQLERVRNYVDEAIKDGGTLLIGGTKSQEGPNFYSPTLITDISIDSRIVNEEVFGPVATIHLFDGVDEAIQIANNSKYTLASAVWTSSTENAQKFTKKVKAGTVWINCYGWFDTVSPWGGTGISGHGNELGKEGLDEFLIKKAIFRG